MNTQTMEGLVGARTNMNSLSVPMRVYKEAERRGDTSAMERAMGYAGEFSQKADAYYDKAEEGMKQDAKEARKQAEEDLEKAIEKRKAEREAFNKRLEKNRKPEEGRTESDVSNKDDVVSVKTGAAEEEKVQEDGKGLAIDISV